MRTAQQASRPTGLHRASPIRAVRTEQDQPHLDRSLVRPPCYIFLLSEVATPRPWEAAGAGEKTTDGPAPSEYRNGTADGPDAAEPMTGRRVCMRTRQRPEAEPRRRGGHGEGKGKRPCVST